MSEDLSSMVHPAADPAMDLLQAVRTALRREPRSRVVAQLRALTDELAHDKPGDRWLGIELRDEAAAGDWLSHALPVMPDAVRCDVEQRLGEGARISSTVFGLSYLEQDGEPVRVVARRPGMELRDHLEARAALAAHLLWARLTLRQRFSILTLDAPELFEQMAAEMRRTQLSLVFEPKAAEA